MFLPQGEEQERLRVALQNARDQARRRSMGNIKFIGELFKLKMLTEAIMHDCVVKLLKNHDEESLECLCRLFSTIGKDLDFEKAKVRKAQTFTHSAPPAFFNVPPIVSDGFEELRKLYKYHLFIST